MSLAVDMRGRGCRMCLSRDVRPAALVPWCGTLGGGGGPPLIKRRRGGTPSSSAARPLWPPARLFVGALFGGRGAVLPP